MDLDRAETLRRWRLEHDELDGEMRRAEAVEDLLDLSQHHAVLARDRARRDQLAFYIAIAERLEAGQEPLTGFLPVMGMNGGGSLAVAVVRADVVEDAGIGMTVTGYLDVRRPWQSAVGAADWVADDSNQALYGWCIHGSAAPGWQAPAALLACGRLIWADAVVANHFTNRFVLLTNAPLGAPALLAAAGADVVGIALDPAGAAQ